MRPTVLGSVGVVPQLNAIGIVSSDFERSRAFYALLGVEVAAGEHHIEATLANGVRLMFDEEHVLRGMNPDWERATGNQVGLAFECSSPDEVNEVYARVVDAGFRGEKEPWDAFWGQRYAQLHDPDGVGVDLYAWL